MSAGISSVLNADLSSLFQEGTLVGLTDGQLLERFLTCRDESGEAAFTALVERHGPMVFRVCRDALQNSADAEDAFQATFLALVRSARSIRKRDSVQSWLFGVARRKASRLRLDAARSRRRHREAVDTLRVAVEEPSIDDLRGILDEELARLPDKYRAPVLLCDLEGLTHDAAARRLGCPPGTVSVRLMRARQRLRGRLLRRGVSLTLGGLAETVAAMRASAGVPKGFIAVVTASAAAETAALGRTTLHGLVIVTALVATSLAYAFVHARDSSRELPRNASTGRVEHAAAQEKKADTLRFHVVERATKRPLPGVGLELRVDGRKGPESTTDESGSATLTLPREDPVTLAVVARKSGYAPMKIAFRGDLRLNRTIPASYSLALSPPVPIGGVVRDEAGRSVEGVVVRFSESVEALARESLALDGVSLKTDAEGRWRAEIIPADFDPVRLQIGFEHPAFMTRYETFDPSATPLAQLFLELKAVTVMHRGVTIEGRVLNQAGQPIPRASVTVGALRGMARVDLNTDAEGRFRAAGLEPRHTRFVIQAAGHATTTRTLRLEPRPKTIEFRLSPGRPLRGRVVDAAGKPAVGAVVVGALSNNWEAFQRRMETDAEGRFRWDDAPDEDVELFAASAGSKESGKMTVAPGQEDILIRLAPAHSLRIRGTVVDDATGRPIPDFTVVPSVEGGHEIVTLEYARTFSDGRYEISPTLGNPTHRIRIEARGYRRSYSPYYQRDSGEQVFDARLTRGDWVEGIVKSPEGTPLAGAEVVMVEGVGLSIRDGRDYQRHNHPHVVTGSDGTFSLSPPPGDFRLVAMHGSGYAEIGGKPFPSRRELRIVPWGRIEGILRAGGKALPSETIAASMKESWTRPESPYVSHDYSSRTDERGHFAIDRVPAGEAMVYRQPNEAIRLSPPTRIYRASFVSVEPGKTSRLNIIHEGGRALTGRLVVPADGGPDLADAEWTAYVVVKRPDPPYPADLPGSESAKWLARWKQTEEGARYRHAERDFGYTVVLQADRSFRVDEIQPGRYVLEVRVRGNSRENRGELARLTREFAVAPPGEQAPRSVDLGVLVLERAVP